MTYESRIREDDADEAYAAGRSARRRGKPMECPDHIHRVWTFNAGWKIEDARLDGRGTTEILCDRFDMITGRAAE